MPELSMLEIYDAFGMEQEPWDGVFMETAAAQRMRRYLGMAIASKKPTRIIAESGTGKTVALDAALEQLNVRKVVMESPGKEQLTIGHVERVLIESLSDETVKANMASRAAQLRRVLGQASVNNDIALTIEDAHRLKPQTIRSLKSILEFEWMGKKKLVTMIMVCQYDSMTQRKVKEMIRRSDTFMMPGMNEDEAIQYITLTVGNYFDQEAVSALSVTPNARNYLDLQIVIVSCMARALDMGRKMVELLDVYDVTGGGLSELMKRAGVSYQDLAREILEPKDTIYAALSGKPTTIKREKKEIIKKKTSVFLKEELKKKGKEKASLQAV